ncbi:MAG: DUF3604 domain-containing protein [Gammaproteobacteria bacterium]|nr:DUF3604 domain-containing protein [Gammaproteobacteria bacterium]MDH3448614.1 DUF3604 domain-containing protein [Gammaproteobacteria bacterium]
MPHSTYLPEKMGFAVVAPTGSFEAGSYQQFTLTYTAGYFGIDDTGSLKIVHRFASDMGRPQFDDPAAPNYVTVEASNGALLHVEYDMKRNIRPWDKTLYIKVVRGFLREGDQIVVRFGDRRHGSPGMRIQTFCEDTFEFKVLVDAIATYSYVELPTQPVIRIVPGPPVLYKAILPTLRRTGERFRLCLKGEDRWGNPSNLCDQSFTLRANHDVDALPASVTLVQGEFSCIIENLAVAESVDLIIELLDADGSVAARSNPCRFVDETPLLPYWGDLHGQSEETIGTNSARDFYEFARDKAFLDICVHQGNDFQITTEFWNWLNELSAEFTEDNRFIVFPGWEWSGNTGLGGDRNVLHMHEGRPIHRSSHALVDDLSDIESDATSAGDLFEALRDEDCTVFAHIGGRYADIKVAHDQRIEKGVEVHSAWGTFEWLVNDAFEQGYRVGILSNSDGHKGRPGASHPGSTKFGAYGGLTCVLAPAFTRAGIMEGLRKRHYYGTTGSRVILDTRVEFAADAELFGDDPRLGDVGSEPVRNAMMGDILHTTDASVSFSIDVHGAAPIERIDIRNGLETLEVFRPYGESELGRRIRVIWEGSEYRGRGRETIWDGHAELDGNGFASVTPINRFNIDKRFAQTAPGRLEWSALTTGGFGGFEALLDDPYSGKLRIETALVRQEIAVADIGRDELIFANGGIERRIRVFRLPDVNPCSALRIEREIGLRDDRDNALYVRVTHEDGHYTWSSPIYLLR